MYAKLLRCTVYACEAALAMGKPQESGETPRISQSASEIFFTLVNARPFPEQSSSIATSRVGPEVSSAGRAWFEAIAQYGPDLSNAVSNAPLAPLRAQTIIIVKVVYFKDGNSHVFFILVLRGKQVKHLSPKIQNELTGC